MPYRLFVGINFKFNMIKKNQNFWSNEGEKIKIYHSKLIQFLENEGYQKVRLSDTSYLLVKKDNNIIRQSSEEEVITTVSNYLKENGEFEVLESFVCGVGNYISTKKLYFLTSIDLINDRDSKDSCRFFFQNCFCNITKESIQVKEYSELENVIWKNRLIKYAFNAPENESKGQFEMFCEKITNNDPVRFEALKSILGYLLHRNKSVGDPKAIILYDENMGKNNQAHGGTGKTLLCLALAICIEAILFNGKEIKTGSWFKNQRVEITSDLLIYDDLDPKIQFDNFFSMITSGIEVEKKRQQSFQIDQSMSPKIVISSNYYVQGPGGPSDKRRRHEFELANYYSDIFTPEMEFGNRFFEEHWDQEEWNKFFYFMMQSVQVYLDKGLIKLDLGSMTKKKIISTTSNNFYDFAEILFEHNEWLDKREYLETYHYMYPEESEVTSHQFTKWVTNYSNENGFEAVHKSSGSKNLFMIKNTKENEERRNEAEHQ
jgi:hypothetical protein